MIAVKQFAPARSKESTYVVQTNLGTDVGFLRKFADTRTERCPWQAWLLDGPVHNQAGLYGIPADQKTTGTYLGAFDSKDAAIEAVAENCGLCPLL